MWELGASDTLHSGESTYVLQMVLHLCGSSVAMILHLWVQPTWIMWYCSIYYWKKSANKWACAAQTHVWVSYISKTELQNEYPSICAPVNK